MSGFDYEKSNKYSNFDLIYEQCSGPGGLQLAEFMACKMGLRPGGRMLDVGCMRGWQTCFLAKEFGVDVLGLDPWNDRVTGRPMTEHLQENAQKWGVGKSILGLQLGVPDTKLTSASFDFVYSTTALEMLRVLLGEDGYLDSLKEIRRLLRPGGVFGLGEPMHLEVELPADLEPYVSQPGFPWKDCFRGLKETAAEVEKAGMRILEADYAPDAMQWWRTYAVHDPYCKQKPEEDPKAIEMDGGRWLSFGYIVAEKP